MTTTEPAVAEWEAHHLHDGVLPNPDTESIRDPGYVLARIRHAMEAADQHAADCGGDRESGGIMLRLMLEDLRGDLANFTEAGEGFLAMLRTCHPDMHWIHASGGGFIGAPPFDRRADDPAMQAIAERCALQLRLNGPKTTKRSWGVPGSRVQPAYRRWTGKVDGWPIVVIDR